MEKILDTTRTVILTPPETNAFRAWVASFDERARTPAASDRNLARAMRRRFRAPGFLLIETPSGAVLNVGAWI